VVQIAASSDEERPISCQTGAGGTIVCGGNEDMSGPQGSIVRRSRENPCSFIVPLQQGIGGSSVRALAQDRQNAAAAPPNINWINW
jgi:hypothetical protein